MENPNTGQGRLSKIMSAIENRARQMPSSEWMQNQQLREYNDYLRKAQEEVDRSTQDPRRPAAGRRIIIGDYRTPEQIQRLEAMQREGYDFLRQGVPEDLRTRPIYADASEEELDATLSALTQRGARIYSGGSEDPYSGRIEYVNPGTRQVYPSDQAIRDSQSMYGIRYDRPLSKEELAAINRSGAIPQRQTAMPNLPMPTGGSSAGGVPVGGGSGAPSQGGVVGDMQSRYGSAPSVYGVTGAPQQPQPMPAVEPVEQTPTSLPFKISATPSTDAGTVQGSMQAPAPEEIPPGMTEEEWLRITKVPPRPEMVPVLPPVQRAPGTMQFFRQPLVPSEPAPVLNQTPQSGRNGSQELPWYAEVYNWLAGRNDG